VKLTTVFLIILIILCNSCYIDKKVLLTPVEPFIHYDNDVEFIGGSQQVSYIGFNNHNNTILYSFIVQSNAKLENVYLQSSVLSIKELGIEIKKENLMNQIINKADIRRKNINPNYEYYFFGQPDLIRFTTEEIHNAYHEKITLNKFYNKFNNVNDLEFCNTIVYEIDGESLESNIIWKDNTKKKTSFVTFFDIIDTLMRQ
jgi:hypothetical protein